MTFGAGAVAWFEGLERDNSRAYFQATRAVFEDEVRGPFEAMLDALCGELGGEARVFRQHRDVRFSADKSPYKTRTYGLLHSVAGTAAAFYAELSARGLYAAAGYWRMGSDQLERYREAVVDEAAGVALVTAVAAVRTDGLELTPPVLKTAPRGMSRDHPGSSCSDTRTSSPARGWRPGRPWRPSRRASMWPARGVPAGPVVEWLDERVGPSALPPRR